MTRRKSRSIKAAASQQKSLDLSERYESLKKSKKYTKYSNGENKEEKTELNLLVELYDELLSIRDTYFEKVQEFFDKDPSKCLNHLTGTSQSIPLRIHTQEQWNQILTKGNETTDRQIVTRNVLLYGKDMETSNWPLTGEPFIFDWDGVRGGGMHRALAGVDVKADITSDFRFGIDPEAIPYTDLVKPKNSANAFFLRGYKKYSSTIAAMAKFMWKYDNNCIFNNSLKEPKIFKLVEWMEEHHPELPNFAQFAKLTASLPDWSTPSSIGCMYYMGSKIDSESADYFFNTLCTGNEIGSTARNHPVVSVRRRLDHDKNSKVKTGQGLKPEYKIAYLIKAWNKYRSGLTISNFTFRSTTKTMNEVFPKMT